MLGFCAVTTTPGVRSQSAPTPTNFKIAFIGDQGNGVDADAVLSLMIEGQAVGNAPAFTSSTGNVSSRARTAASVSWNPPAWDNKNAAGAAQQTPDLSAVIEEIVGQDDGSANQWLVLIITGTGERVAESYKGTAAGAPLLVVEYTN